MKVSETELTFLYFPIAYEYCVFVNQIQLIKITLHKGNMF